ncbi:MAG: DUF2029 domain-containing protein [Paludibacteraceae bacterium]|nr:DUF2029 domain-containing protein [Paludibacteraceae bacterium]
MKKFFAFFTVSRNVYWLGFVIAVAASLIELLRGGAENYCVFRDATLQFWQGINPYTQEFVDVHHRYFIYSPIFCVLFAPFAFMPFYLGGLVWNLFGYTVFYFGVKNLPGVLSAKAPLIMLYLLLTVAQSLFCFQFNLLVAAIFVWALVLLERDQPFWAILLIMISATTKIYGAVELALLLFYPRFWRNVGCVLLTGIGLLLLPALHGGVEGLLSGYQNWLAQLVSHQSTGIYYSFLFLPGIRSFALPYMRLFQASVLLLMAIPFAFQMSNLKSEISNLKYKMSLLAALMGYIVLFSEAAEYTTYTITMTGYALWYFLEDKRPLVDRILFWALFVLWCVMPIDLFCPSKLCNYIHSTLWIGVLTYTVAWVRMIYITCKRSLRGS